MRRILLGSVAGAFALTGLTGIAPAQAASGTTYTVTSGALCGGAGTFEQAVKDANANPGKDTIEFTAGITVDASTCFDLHPGSANQFPIAAMESVDIIGHSAKIIGQQFWSDLRGEINNIAMCPSDKSSGSSWMSVSRGFMSVGEYGKDNTGIAVTTSELLFDNLPEIFAVYDKGALTLTSSRATNINSFNGSCNRSAISAFASADITLRDVQIDHSYAPGMLEGDNDFEGLISGDTGDLIMERVFFAANGQGRAVVWGGPQGSGSVKIVSSKFAESGGFRLNTATAEIVNTAFYANSHKPVGRITVTNGVVKASGSTFYWEEPYCTDPNCIGGGMGFLTAGGGKVVFNTSALGTLAALPNSGPLLFGDTTAFSSDASTWVQPTANQSAGDIASVLPQAKTAAPGLLSSSFVPDWIDSITPVLGTPANPGVLVDAITDAQCGGASALINPIDGSCIKEDVLGNPRWDSGNGRRNIGAVQNVASPHLISGSTTSTQVDLSWNRPTDPASGPITGYNVYYSPVAGGLEQVYYVAGATRLKVTIPGLTSGTPYRFTVSGVNKVGPGPRSNEVVEAPKGRLDAMPVVTRPGNGQVTLAWPEPNLNGHVGPPSYWVQFRKKGETAWTQGPGGVSTRIATIPSLDNRTEYEFAVTATVPDQSAVSPYVVVKATPRAASFVPIDPARAYDSRVAGAGGPISDGESRVVSVAGQVPEKAVAVAYNITVTGMTGSGYLTVTPGNTATPPLSSTINWTGPNQLLANGLVVGVDDKRQIKVFAGGAGDRTDFVVDVVGYYLPFADTVGPEAGVFTPISPVRAYDSRIDDHTNTAGPLAGGSNRLIDLSTNTGGTLPAGTMAIAYNLTVTGMTKTGYLAVAPGTVTQAPNTSTINWWTGNQVLANGIDVKIDNNKEIRVFAGGTGQTEFVIDIVGYFAPTTVTPQGTGFNPIEPVRSYDSRTKDGPIAAGDKRNISVSSGGAVPTSAEAIAYNLTETGTSGTGFLTVYPGNVTTPPTASTINWYRPLETMANGIATGIDPSNRTVNVYAGGKSPANDKAEFVIDTVGFYN